MLKTMMIPTTDQNLLARPFENILLVSITLIDRRTNILSPGKQEIMDQNQVVATHRVSHLIIRSLFLWSWEAFYKPSSPSDPRDWIR